MWLEVKGEYFFNEDPNVIGECLLCFYLKHCAQMIDEFKELKTLFILSNVKKGIVERMWHSRVQKWPKLVFWVNFICNVCSDISADVFGHRAFIRAYKTDVSFVYLEHLQEGPQKVIK